MLPPVVADDEPIARFIRSGSHMRLGIGRPAYAALMPPSRSREMSVCRSAGLTPADLRSIGAAHVEHPPQVLKGYCVLPALDYRQENLDVVAAPQPFPEHANVVGWPPGPDARVIAKRLADKAALVVY